jgi:hypothetical protein
LFADKCETIKQHNILSAGQAAYKQRSSKTKPTTSTRGSNRKTSVKISKKQCNVNRTSQEFESCGKDRQLPIFQRVGRLLYPKSKFCSSFVNIARYFYTVELPRKLRSVIMFIYSITRRCCISDP